jgi:pyruvate/2-oxoglutarate dehydrogenase complex dihydrolipoamide dehydrogenase (E3) component
LAQVLARFGVKVTVVEASERLLPAEEPEASEELETAFQSEGINVQTGAEVVQVNSNDNSISVTIRGGKELVGEKLLVATGRRVELSSLGLESARLDGSAKALPVDNRMRAADGIWGMGDVTGVAMFTHVALYQSAIVAADILGETVPPARYDAVPRVTFTDPEVASVGITEAQARAAGQDIVVAVKKLPATFRGWLHASGSGVIKLIVDRQSGTLVGATAAGPHGGEMLGLLSLAVHAGIKLDQLRSMIYPFPTFYGAIGEAIGAYGRGLATVIDPAYEGFRMLDRIGKTN